MFFGSLAFIFEVMVYVGLGLPLVHLIVSAIGAAGDSSADMDADFSADGGLDAGPDFDTPDLEAPEIDFEAEAPDIDMGGAPTASPSGGFSLRFNLYCLCLSFVVMGATGIYALEALSGTAQAVMLIAGAALAVAA